MAGKSRKFSVRKKRLPSGHEYKVRVLLVRDAEGRNRGASIVGTVRSVKKVGKFPRNGIVYGAGG